MFVWAMDIDGLNGSVVTFVSEQRNPYDLHPQLTILNLFCPQNKCKAWVLKWDVCSSKGQIKTL